MSYNFAAVPLGDARAWFDMLITRVNNRFGKMYYSPMSNLTTSTQEVMALAMKQFLENDVAPRVSPNASPTLVTVPTLDEIATTVLALNKKDKQRIYQLLYNDGCRVNR